MLLLDTPSSYRAIQLCDRVAEFPVEHPIGRPPAATIENDWYILKIFLVDGQADYQLGVNAVQLDRH